MKVSFEKVKELLEKNNYIPNDELVWNTVKAIKKMIKGNQKGQGIYSIVLEGPPGAGKSFYVETYKKVLQEFFDEDVELVEYQCDSTTGKSDLYEEIDVAQAISGDSEKVIIEGKLLEAIRLANEGKKVILFLDEFEKSRRETDAFMFGFEQSGKVITTHKGEIEVRPEFRKILQLILCKNDERELSDPLLRRNRIIRLELMTPENFATAINMNLSNLDEDIRNIVILLYQKIYENREMFVKVPSCSEGMLAVQDACDLLEENAPAEVIYADILSNMLKHPDDIESFKSMFEKDSELGTFVQQLLQMDSQDKTYSARDEIYRNFFSKEIQELSGAKQLYEKLCDMKQGQPQQGTAEQVNSVVSSSNTRPKRKQSKENNSSQEDSIENVLKMEEMNLSNLEPMPMDLIKTPKRVFEDNPTGEWHEIMEFEVDEDGWETVRELVETGIEPYIEQLIRQYTPKNKPNYDVEKNESYQMEKKRREQHFSRFKGSLCIDGIVLNDDEKEGVKIVAIKEKRDNSHFYRIFSNRRVQTISLFGFAYDNYHSNQGFGTYITGSDIYMGINGLAAILSEKKRLLKVRKNYLLFSITTENYIKRLEDESNSKYNDRERRDGCKKGLKIINKKFKGILPGVFLVTEEVTQGNEFRGINDEIGSEDVSARTYVNPRVTNKFISMYEGLLERAKETTPEEVGEDGNER